MIIRPMTLSESGESTKEVSIESCFGGNLNIRGMSKVSLEEITSIITRGGWPLAIRNNDTGSSYVKGYIREIAEQDASRADGIEKDPAKLMLFMKALARATATSTSMKNIRADVHHFADPSIAAALPGAGPGDLVEDPETFGLLFESLVIRDLRVYAEAIGGNLACYMDSNGLEADAIIHFSNSKWTASEVKLGISWVDKAAERLQKLASITERKTEFLMTIVPDGYAYRRKDGVLVCPISCLKP